MIKEKTILIVEDEPVLIRALEIRLVKSGFKVILTKDGKEGLEQSLTLHPDLILLDLVMPVMDGLTMLRKLREDDWGKKAEVFVLSNLSDEDKQVEATELGVENYLIKSDESLENLVKIIKKRHKGPKRRDILSRL